MLADHGDELIAERELERKRLNYAISEGCAEVYIDTEDGSARVSHVDVDFILYGLTDGGYEGFCVAEGDEPLDCHNVEVDVRDDEIWAMLLLQAGVSSKTLGFGCL